MSECFAKIAFLRYLSWVFLARKKNPCYFCDICGNFGALLGFFFFKVLILVRFVILAIFAIFVTGVFSSQQKSLLILRYFADISGPFLVSSLSKSRILLYLLFLRFLRYLQWVVLGSKKNPYYICDVCDICGHFRVLLSFFFLKS